MSHDEIIEQAAWCFTARRTKRRLLREAIARGNAAQQRELTLQRLTGWDLDNLNHAIAHGDVEIMPSEETRNIISEMARTSAYSLREITEMMSAISRWDFKRRPEND